MKKLITSSLFSLIVGALAFSGASICQASPITFAQFIQGTVSISKSPTSNTLTGSGTVQFFYTGSYILPPALQGSQSATFSFTATTNTPATNTAGSISQSGYSGTFSFTRSTVQELRLSVQQYSSDILVA